MGSPGSRLHQLAALISNAYPYLREEGYCSARELAHMHIVPRAGL